ncbi:MAG TPA: sigma-70 family RNA polymerase sigma factor [Ilumatobacteraceae bacterium]|nr:sigma-70 family RNA polymerase sigma factor [Ilumatobacteraceae bacterium]
MSDRDALADRFEADRSRLLAVAGRLLGSAIEAEDAVQEAWLRLERTDADSVEKLGGWLTTVVSRVCLDRLRARRTGPELGIDDEVPPPRSATDTDPEHEVVLADSIGSALLVVLERLSPGERVAFVLHDVFAMPFEDVAQVLDRSPDATRQLASRARRRVQGGHLSSDLDVLRRRQLVEAFLTAARGGDFDGLLAVLDPEVALRPDNAALRMGSLRETRGAAAVASALAGGAQTARLALVDGLPALVWAPGGTIRGVIEFRVAADRIVGLDVTGDAARIGELEIVLLDN